MSYSDLLENINIDNQIQSRTNADNVRHLKNFYTLTFSSI